MKNLTKQETIDQLFMALIDIKEDNEDKGITVNNDELSKLLTDKLIQRGFNLVSE